MKELLRVSSGADTLDRVLKNSVLLQHLSTKLHILQSGNDFRVRQ